MPAEARLGAGWPNAIVVGRLEKSDYVLPLKAASKLHCQFALRTFRMPGEETVHEALFLRDVSRNHTLVNGKAALRPWHWLRDGDLIGLNLTEPGGVLNFWRVCYRRHLRIQAVTPASASQSEEKGPLPPFGPDVCGKVVDITYTLPGPPVTYRMRIVKFQPKNGWHKVDSRGLSLWDGESFTDTVDLNLMHTEGNIVFVSECEASSRKRARTQGA